MAKKKKSKKKKSKKLKSKHMPLRLLKDHLIRVTRAIQRHPDN